jgi:hypothetical protein
MKAIILVYSEYQNCPSKPKSTLYDLPDDVEQRNVMLRELFGTVACDGADCITVYNEPTEFGDITVSDHTVGVHMYITFVVNS